MSSNDFFETLIEITKIDIEHKCGNLWFVSINTYSQFHFSRQGDTVISILIDLNGFWTYENREVLIADNNAEEGQV